MCGLISDLVSCKFCKVWSYIHLMSSLSLNNTNTKPKPKLIHYIILCTFLFQANHFHEEEEQNYGFFWYKHFWVIVGNYDDIEQYTGILKNVIIVTSTMEVREVSQRLQQINAILEFRRRYVWK